MDMGAQRNYACINCGRVFGRIFCATRHAMNRVCGNGSIRPLADYLAGRQIGMYNPSSICRRPSVNRGEEQLFDKKRIARKYFEQLENKWIEMQVGQDFSRLRPNNDHHSRDQSDEITVNPIGMERRDIFGYRGFVCGKCLVIFTCAFFFGDRQYGSRHRCEPHLLDRSWELGLQKERIIEEFRQELPLNLKNAVCTCLPSSRVTLLAIDISYSGNEPIKIPNPNNPGETISITCSQEKFIELTTSDNLSLNHWAIRASCDGRTSLTDEELTDFLKKVVDATFAVVAVKWPSVGTVQEKLKKLYFMYLVINQS